MDRRARHLGQEFYRLTINYGFMEDPNIPAVLADLKPPGPAFDPAGTTYFCLPPERVVEMGPQVEI